MKLTELWVVRDPGPRSELADICFCTTPVGFANYYAGVEAGKAGFYATSNHALFVGDNAAGESLEEAMGRIHTRGPVAQ